MNSNFVRERITQLRMQKGVSEYKMSYDLGHSRGYINNISSGKSMPSMVELFAICEYFHISPVEFFYDAVQNPRQMNQLLSDLEQLSSEDLDLVHLMVKRLLKN